MYIRVTPPPRLGVLQLFHNGGKGGFERQLAIDLNPKLIRERAYEGPCCFWCLIAACRVVRISVNQ